MKAFYKNDLLCTKCGSVFPIRTKNKISKYSEMDNWCLICKKETKFIAVGDAQLMKKELEFLGIENLNEAQERISELLFKDNESKRIK